MPASNAPSRCMLLFTHVSCIVLLPKYIVIGVLELDKYTNPLKQWHMNNTLSDELVGATDVVLLLHIVAGVLSLVCTATAIVFVYSIAMRIQNKRISVLHITMLVILRFYFV